MVVLSAELRFYLPDVHSLKDKRQIGRSLMERAKHKFNAAIAEVDNQDAHQRLTIGVAVVSGEGRHAQEMLEEVIRYMEGNTQALQTIREGKRVSRNVAGRKYMPFSQPHH